MPRTDKGPTIKTIAESVGCSAAVVSKVLNKARGTSNCSPEMRLRIQEVAQDLNYRPHFAAQSLIRQSTRTIGLYIAPSPWAGLANANYQGPLVSGVEHACAEAGYNLLAVNLAHDHDVSACVKAFEESRIDGLVVIQPRPDEAGVESVLPDSANVAVIGHSASHGKFASISFDNSSAISQAIDHLAGLGHTRIGFLGSCIEVPLTDSQQRRDAYLRLMAEHGLDVHPSWVHDRSNCRVSISADDHYCDLEGYWGLKHLWGLPEQIRPTAILAYNDLVAAGAYMWAREAGIDIPSQLSVVGIDNIDLCRYLSPQLTSLEQPMTQLGAAAARLVIRRSSPAGSTATRGGHGELSLEARLVLRKSTAAPK